MKLYCSFVVRCWQEPINDAPVWRFALVEIGQTEQTRGFAEFNLLMAYLSERLGNASQVADTKEDSVAQKRAIDFTPISQDEF